MDLPIERKRAPVVSFPESEHGASESMRERPPVESAEAEAQLKASEREHPRLSQLKKMVSEAYVLLFKVKETRLKMRRAADRRESLPSGLERDMKLLENWAYGVDKTLETIAGQDEVTRMKRIPGCIKSYPWRAARRLRTLTPQKEQEQAEGSEEE